MGSLQVRLFVTYFFIIVVTLGLATLSLFLMLGGYRDSITYGNLETLGPFVRSQVGIASPDVLDSRVPDDPVPVGSDVLLSILGVRDGEEGQRLRTITTLAVVDGQGRVLPTAWTGPANIDEDSGIEVSVATAISAGSDIVPRRCTLEMPEGAALLCVAMPLRGLDRVEEAFGPTAVGLVVATPAAGMGDVLGDLMPRLLFAGLTGLAAALVLGVLLSQSVAAPLRNIALAARNVSRGNYRQRVPVTGPSEVRDLASNFNRMTGEVQSSQQTLRDFLANISHELKTPLTSIRGFSEAVLDGTIDEPEGIRRSARIINDESGRVLRLVEELLDLSRIESGQISMRKELLRFDELFEHLEALFALRSEETDVQLEVSNTATAVVEGDYDRLEQVLNNLLDNAFRHTRRGGLIRLTARELHDGAVQVMVSDNGVGIAAEDLPNLFSRFYRARNTADGQQKGHGLGLAISREIVRAHGGEIWVTSEENKGTTFIFTLPIADQTIPRVVSQ